MKILDFQISAPSVEEDVVGPESYFWAYKAWMRACEKHANFLKGYRKDIPVSIKMNPKTFVMTFKGSIHVRYLDTSASDFDAEVASKKFLKAVTTALKSEIVLADGAKITAKAKIPERDLEL